MGKLNAFIFLFFFLIGCNTADETPIPEYIQGLENLEVYSNNVEAPVDVELKRDVVYRSTDEALIGTITNIVVDDRGRVFLGEGKPGQGVIYVYRPDGSYLTTLGRFGRGPGDLLNIRDMDIYDDQLYVFNGVYTGTQISVFSLDDLSFSHTILLSMEGKQEDERLLQMYPGGKMEVVENGFLMDFQGYMPITEPEDTLYKRYYHRDKQGNLIPEQRFKLRWHDFIFPDSRPDPGSGIPPGGITMPFSRSSLLAVSDEGTIFTAWTEDFLIKVLDHSGNYQHSFYYPHEKVDLPESEALSLTDHAAFEKLLSRTDLPDTWPALHTMLVDDQNQLWIFTVTESETEYEGWIVNEEGELLGRFNWPGRKFERMVRSDENKIVKNGFLYDIETDEESGLYRAVRYKISTDGNIGNLSY